MKGEVLAKFDILCLQEVFSGNGNTRKIEMIESAKEAGLEYVFACPEPEHLYERCGGTVIVSRFPIIEQDFIGFQPGVQNVYYKGVSYAKIQVGDERSLHIFNTHLQHSDMSFTNEENE